MNGETTREHWEALERATREMRKWQRECEKNPSAAYRAFRRGAEIEVDVLLRQLAQGDAVTARLPSPSSSLFDTVEERELLLVGANNKPHYWAGLED